MKSRKRPIPSPFLQNKEAIKNASIQTLRDSFEIEGVFFTDEEIQQMVEKVRGERVKL